jgi:hypothetical protein
MSLCQSTSYLAIAWSSGQAFVGELWEIHYRVKDDNFGLFLAGVEDSGCAWRDDVEGQLGLFCGHKNEMLLL